MSNHPYGLRGDPFASPATLSPKDASRLIRRRVRAFNGDGGTLFPIDTCDLIHEIAGGIPDAMLELAGRAMRIAAAEGAAAVSPAHVRKAADPGSGSVELATASPSVPAVAGAPAGRGTGRAARAIDALLEVTEEALRESGTGAANDDARTEAECGAASASDAEAPAQHPQREPNPANAGSPPEDAGAPAQDQRREPNPSSVVPSPEEEPATAAAADYTDDDQDLPPFQPAAFTLPTRPSEELDPDAREWVSRFISSSGTVRVPEGPGRVTPAPTTREVTPASTVAPVARPAAEPEPVLAVVHAARSPRRALLRHGPQRRRRSGGHHLLIAMAAVCVIAFVVRMSVRGTLVSPGSEPAPPTPTSAPAVERPTRVARPAPTSSDQAVGEPAPTGAPARAAPPHPDLAPTLHAPTVGPTGAVPTSPSGAAPVEPVRRPGSTGKFGLEVATFIFEERARLERDRLVGAGLRARVVTTVEYGSRVYRVVVGGFPHPAAAERAADSLLANGVVLQARVVTVPSGR